MKTNVIKLDKIQIFTIIINVVSLILLIKLIYCDNLDLVMEYGGAIILLIYLPSFIAKILFWINIKNNIDKLKDGKDNVTKSLKNKFLMSFKGKILLTIKSLIIVIIVVIKMMKLT